MRAKNTVVGKLLASSDKFNREQIEQTVDMLLEHAHMRGATDIHVEPRERFVLIRYRIDGVLRGIHKLPLESMGSLSNELKMLSNINPVESDVPQDGQFETDISGQSYLIKVSTLPVIDGEKIVLKLVPHMVNLVSLESLGLWGDNLETVRYALTSTRGLIAVSGPKRSGKTTTLYSLINVMSTPLTSVVTVEDPIEHRIRGISQTQVRSRRGVGFSEGLQAALQQDANIVMLSNLSDKQTIELAVHSANSGHVILAGVPADDACRAVLQLRSSGVSHFVLATALNIVIAQRLVRHLCPNCRKRFSLNENQRELLGRAFNLHKASAKRQLNELEKTALKEKLGDHGPLNSTPLNITHLWQASSDGCKACEFTGYQGQISLIEVLKLNETLRSELQQQHVTLENFESTALSQGFVPLFTDGLVKALRGLTSIEELLRVMPTS